MIKIKSFFFKFSLTMQLKEEKKITKYTIHQGQNVSKCKIRKDKQNLEWVFK